MIPAATFVLNAWPTGSTATNSGVSVIRFANGQVTLFDSNGESIPVQNPNSSVQNYNPFTLLGSNPGSSVIHTLVVPNIDTFASSEDATIVKSYNSPGGTQYEDVAYPASGTPMVDLSVAATSYETQNSTWTYYSSNGYWIAHAITSYPKFPSGSGSVTTYFQNVSWNDNSSADSARAAKGNTALAPPPSTTSQPSGLSAPSSTTSSTIVNSLGGSQNVSFAHGLLSNPGTWSRMTGWLNQDFLFGTEVVPSLSSTDHISSQASSLESILNSAGGNGYVLIGHSDGGLVSRAAAQYYQGTTTPTKGVTTVDSPNEGADIAGWASGEVAGVGAWIGQDLWDWIGCGSPYDNWGCYIGALAFDGGFAYLSNWAANTAVPVIGDITPSSSYLGQLNNFAESFTQVGVVSNTPQLWDEVRLLDDAAFMRFNCYPETWCGERVAADFTNIFFYTLFVEEIYAWLNGDWADAIWLAGIQVDMLALDGFWNTVVSGGAASDGLVQSSSQNYPYSGATQYQIDGADSHLGSTTSTYSPVSEMRLLLEPVRTAAWRVLNGQEISDIAD